MKTKILKILVALPLTLILCLGIMLVNFNFTLPSIGQPESPSMAFFAPLEAGDELYDFADALINSWFEDCLRYVNENDPTYEELETEYGKIKAELDSRTDLDVLKNMLVFITSSYNRLDKIYYLWECNTYSEELEEAYKNLKDSGAYSGNKAKIDETYNKVFNLITAFENELDPEDPDELDNTELSLVNIRVSKSSEIETELGDALALFDKIEREWKQKHDLILWLSISGGILLLALIVVMLLLLIMRKRNKKYKATLVSLNDLQRLLDEDRYGK